MCDEGKENEHFKNMSAILDLYTIPGPIHVDLNDRHKHTQTVEGSHAGPKMRLRLGRGLRRHNLQSVMDFEDFVCNRTDGTPQDIFKHLGEAATQYIRLSDLNVTRTSLISTALHPDTIHPINGLTIPKIKQISRRSVYGKAKKYIWFVNPH